MALKTGLFTYWMSLQATYIIWIRCFPWQWIYFCANMLSGTPTATSFFSSFPSVINSVIDLFYQFSLKRRATLLIILLSAVGWLLDWSPSRVWVLYFCTVYEWTYVVNFFFCYQICRVTLIIPSRPSDFWIINLLYLVVVSHTLVKVV